MLYQIGNNLLDTKRESEWTDLERELMAQLEKWATRYDHLYEIKAVKRERPVRTAAFELELSGCGKRR